MLPKDVPEFECMPLVVAILQEQAFICKIVQYIEIHKIFTQLFNLSRDLARFTT